MDAKLLLCDFAEVSGGKMFISGTGIGILASSTPSPPYRTSVSLAILVILGVEDTNAPHNMSIELVFTNAGNETRVVLNDELPDGADPADRGMILAQFLVPRSEQMSPEDELTMPMAIPLFGLPLPQLGLYYFSVRIDGREMDRATFRAVLPPPPQGAPPMAGADVAGDGAPEPPL